METVITVLDNGKLLKPQTLEDGELTPYFKIKKQKFKENVNLEKNLKILQIWQIILKVKKNMKKQNFIFNLDFLFCHRTDKNMFIK